MKTPSILTLSFTALLFGISWAGIRSAQALQDAPAAIGKPAEEESSGDKLSEAASSDASPEDAAKADALLAEARSRLEDRQSLQADMKQQILVGDRKLIAEGTYISGAPYPKLRLEYRIRVGTMQGSLTEVCDGQILHTEKSVGRVGATDLDQQFTRRDVQRILAARDNAVNMPIASQGAELGIGGLPAMLASIDRCMVGVRVTEEEFEGQMCRVFHGAWDQEVLKKYDAALKEQKAALVPFFPDQVQAFFTTDTVTPVKIVYLKNELSETGKITGERALMILELRNLKLDQPVPPATFQYVLPPKREEIDRTNEFLDLIKQADSALGDGQPATSKKK